MSSLPLHQDEDVPPAPPSVLARFPLISRLLAILIILMYIAGASFPGLRHVFAIVPNRVTHGYIWQVFTAGFFDVSVVTAVTNAIICLFVGSVLEPLWGPREYVRFIAIVNTAVGICLFMVAIFVYFMFGNEATLSSPIGGFGGVIAGFTVACKQTIPEHALSLLCLQIRVKHLPLMLLCTAVVLSMIARTLPEVPYTLVGMLVSWIYLRFYQHKPEGRGDLSHQFAAISFVPEEYQDSCERLLYRVSWLRPYLSPPTLTDSPTASAQHQASHVAMSAGDDDISLAEVERRRQLGQRTLDRILARNPTMAESPPPPPPMVR